MKLASKLAAAAVALAMSASAVQAQTTLYLTGLKVTDLARSVAFYRDVMGLKEVRRYGDGKTFVEVLFNSSGAPGQAPNLVLVWDGKHTGPYDQGPNAGFSRIGVQTPDAKALVARVRAGGGKVTGEPQVYQQTGSVLAHVTDPDGYPIEVIQPAK